MDLRWQVMANAVEHQQARAFDAPCEPDAAARPDERVGGPMNDQRRLLDFVKAVAGRAGCEHSGELPRCPGFTSVVVEACCAQIAPVWFIKRIVLAGEHAPDICESLYSFIAPLRRRPHEHLRRGSGRQAVQSRAAAGVQ